ncbi:hypothetical protein [Achromobacter sp. Root83]|uniref:hypothetical protein n=1 Tax=Achromobacter sp. Root83 TaxID=1736602 RepID=UPI0012E3A666|nr:hypothetical protein [Achromobacter sp. Root83]
MSDCCGPFRGVDQCNDEQDLPACGSDTAYIQNKLLERDVYVAGLTTSTSRLSDPLIAGMDLLDSRNLGGTYDWLQLKDALVRFQSGAPDYTSEVDRVVVESMLLSPVVFAAVKGLSPLDSDGGGGTGPKKPGNTGGGQNVNGILLTEARATKIFGSREGHVMDTPENRELWLVSRIILHRSWVQINSVQRGQQKFSQMVLKFGFKLEMGRYGTGG